MRNFRNLKILALIVSALFALEIILRTGTVLGSIFMIALPDQTFETDEGSINIGLFFVGLLSLFELALRVVLIIVFLIFVNRGFKNLHAFGILRSEFRPVSAVVWWFIPIFNFWMPFKIMSELWNASDPELELDRNAVPPGKSAPETILFWWLAFIFGSIAGRISGKMFDAARLKYFPVASLVSAILLGVSAALAIGIVRGIAARQEARISQFDRTEPPAPPTFDDETSV